MNRMMKKISAMLLPFLLCLSLVFISLPSAAAGTTNQEDINLLTALGIIGQEQPSAQPVSRELFAGMLCRAAGLPVAADEARRYAAEESQKGYAGSMEAAVRSGLMSPQADGSFGANYPVVWEEALSAFIKALGYDVTAPDAASRITKGHSIGLLKGLTYQQGIPVTFGETAHLFANALETELLKQTGFGTTDEYTAVKGVNLLSEVFDVYRADGILNATPTAALGLGRTAPKKGVIIDETAYQCPDGLAAEDYLGRMVRAYYRQPEGEDEKTILLLQVPAGKNNVLMIDGQDVRSDAVKGSFHYESKDGWETERIDPAADLVVNGRTVDFTAGYRLAIPDSALCLVDNNADGVYEVVIVRSFVNYYVSGVGKEEMSLRDSYGQKSLRLSDIKHLTITKDGAAADFDAIKPGMVVSVYADRELYVEGHKMVDTANATVYRLEVCGGKASATVSELRTSPREAFVAGGTTYEYADSLKRALSLGYVKRLAAGDSIALFTDAAGRVAAYEIKRTGSVQYGYLINCGIQQGGLGDGYQLKLMDEKGAVDSYDVADKIKLDGEMVKTNDIPPAMEGRLKQNGAVKREVVRFTLNGQGEVSMLDTTYLNPLKETDKDSLVKSYDGAGATLYYNQSVGRIFGGKIILGDAAKVFVVPDPQQAGTSDDDYYVADESYFGSTGDFYVSSYDAKTKVSNLVVAYDTANFPNSIQPVIVSGMGVGLNEEGDEVYYINGYDSKGDAVSLPLKRNEINVYNGNSKTPSPTLRPEQFQLGDVLRCATDQMGRVSAIQYLFSSRNPGAFKASGSNYDASFRTVYGRVNEVSGNIVEVAPDGNLDNQAGTEAFVLTGVPVYEVADGRIRRVGIEGISGYLPGKNAADADNIFLFTSRSKPSIAVLIK